LKRSLEKIKSPWKRTTGEVSAAKALKSKSNQKTVKKVWGRRATTNEKDKALRKSQKTSRRGGSGDYFRKKILGEKNHREGVHARGAGRRRGVLVC